VSVSKVTHRYFKTVVLNKNMKTDDVQKVNNCTVRPYFMRGCVPEDLAQINTSFEAHM
jgi:hypothetical protein